MVPLASQKAPRLRFPKNPRLVARGPLWKSRALQEGLRWSNPREWRSQTFSLRYPGLLGKEDSQEGKQTHEFLGVGVPKVPHTHSSSFSRICMQRCCCQPEPSLCAASYREMSWHGWQDQTALIVAVHCQSQNVTGRCFPGHVYKAFVCKTFCLVSPLSTPFRAHLSQALFFRIWLMYANVGRRSSSSLFLRPSSSLLSEAL